MPVPIPTPDELARMSWRQRGRALTAARAALAALEAGPGSEAPRPVVVGRADSSRSSARPQGKAAPPPRRPGAEVWGDCVRGEAKRLLAAMPPDPEAEAHTRVLYFAARP